MVNVVLAHAICAEAEALAWSDSRALLDPAEIEADWRRWLPAVAPKVFSHAPAWFHAQYWDWLWPLMARRRSGEPIADVPLAALLIWGRGLGKSTTLEFSAVAEGALIERAFGIYLSSTQDKANEHVAAIRDAVEGSQVARFYPGLANPRVGKFGNQRGWRQEAVYTDSGFAIVGAGLDKGVRGLKDIAQRPTIFFIDDVDERDDTPLIVDKKVQTILKDVLPMAELSNPKPLVIFGQNLIHRGSVAAKTLRREIALLGYRAEFGPVNTFGPDLEIEKRDGRKMIVAGSPNWDRIGVGEAQTLLDSIGEDAFLSECQNEMRLSDEERVLSQYNEALHVITWSDFEKQFGTRKIPAHWEIHGGHDWGTTGPQAHPAVFSLVAVAADDSPLPGDAFLFWARTSEAAETEHQIARRLIEELPRLAWHPGAAQALESLQRSDHQANEARMWAMRQQAGSSLPFTSLRGSHEQERGALRTYRQKWGLPIRICDSGKLAGLSQIHHYLEPERLSAHPFKAGVMGRPNFYFVVADDQLLEARDDAGLKRHREEALTLKWDPNIAGRDVPMKRGDDAIDSLKMIFQGFPLSAAALTAHQKRELRLPEGVRAESVEKLTGDARDLAEMQRDYHVKKLEREEGQASTWSNEVVDSRDNPWANIE